ncbi:MAG TPA: hypothetical protein PLG90_12705 [Ignavibacteria bacterium]|nr:hypothetical protein [Ignavibacteria bacterium]
MKKILIVMFFLISITQTGYANSSKVVLDSVKSGNKNTLQIDTNTNLLPVVPLDTIKQDSTPAVDSLLIPSINPNELTNTKLFVYILLSVLGAGLFYFIFVVTLFRTFHKKRSTRQSLLLSWSLFFAITVVWLFIIWGVVAGFQTSAAFLVTMIFLFIVSLIMLIIAIKSN